MSQKNSFVKKGQLWRSLVATALIANGIFQCIAPVLAEGTAANQEIDNTATATYEDDDDPNTPPINATSNTVTITVAEVAGITVVGAGPEFKPDGDANNDGKFNARDEFYFIYDVENVGNDPTKFQIPGEPIVNGPGTLDGQVEISYDGGANWETVDRTNGLETNSVEPGEIVKVRVPVRVNDDAPTDAKISVELGNTGDGNPANDLQNVPRIENPEDIYTVDNGNEAPGEVDGIPVNATREASATQEITVDSTLTTYTLAKILKNNSNYTSAGAIGPIEDTLDYNLTLEVLNTDPTGNNISPVALEGQAVPGLTGNNILVSDAIPAGTKLKSVAAPDGWTVVYTDNPITTQKAPNAEWTTTPPSNLATVTRVGFVKTGSVNPGETIPGFNITVEVTSTESSLIIANVAQLFGKTPSGQDVYDESGDQQPSNYNEVGQVFPGTDNTPGEVPTTIPDDQIDDGYIDPTDTKDENGDDVAGGNGIPDELESNTGYGIDTLNDNSGTGPGGEANFYTINPVGASSVLNGPQNEPDANIDGDNNIDFTNKSAQVPADESGPGDTVTNPSDVTFTNTLQNSGNSNADIILEPKVPDTPSDLPDGTEVTITYDNNGTVETAEYSYTEAGGFELLTSTRDDGAATPSPLPIKIFGVASNDTRDYTVVVTLPNDTPLSTNDNVNRGYPVPIRAFVDNDNNGLVDQVDTDNDGTADTPAENITIDRVYLGYLKLVKTSRILDSEGNPKEPNDGSFNGTNKSPSPGDIIEFKIEYQNISEEQSGPGNIVLTAKNIEIVEDGTTGGSNWALDNDNDGEIDTINVPDTAVAADATITFLPSGDNKETTRYEVTSEVAPGITKTFTFQRQVNKVSPTGTANNGAP